MQEQRWSHSGTAGATMATASSLATGELFKASDGGLDPASSKVDMVTMMYDPADAGKESNTGQSGCGRRSEFGRYVLPIIWS